MSTYWLTATFSEIEDLAHSGKVVCSVVESPESLRGILNNLKKEIDELEDYIERGPCKFTKSHSSRFCGRKMCG